MGNKESSIRKSSFFTTRKGSRILVMITFMAFPLLLLLVFTYLPFFRMVQFSFYDMGYIGKRVFVGLKNYRNVFVRDDCFGALKLSGYYLVGAFVQLGLALFFASILSQKMRGGGVFKGLLFFPFLVCGIAVGFIFKFFYTRGFVLDMVLQWCGFRLEQLPYWLRDTKVNNVSLAATSLWRYMGQNMVLFIGAISSVDSELYEAASTDGANGWQSFKHITFPGIKTIVVLNIILSISGSLSVFEPPYVTTGGEFGTATYFVVMDKLAHVSQKVGLASAMAVVLMLLILLVTSVQKWIEWYFLGTTGRDAQIEMNRRKKRARSAGFSGREKVAAESGERRGGDDKK